MSLAKLYNHAKSEITPTDAYSGMTADFKARIASWAYLVPSPLWTQNLEGKKKGEDKNWTHPNIFHGTWRYN